MLPHRIPYKAVFFLPCRFHFHTNRSALKTTMWHRNRNVLIKRVTACHTTSFYEKYCRNLSHQTSSCISILNWEKYWIFLSWVYFGFLSRIIWSNIVFTCFLCNHTSSTATDGSYRTNPVLCFSSGETFSIDRDSILLWKRGGKVGLVGSLRGSCVVQDPALRPSLSHQGCACWLPGRLLACQMKTFLQVP